MHHQSSATATYSFELPNLPDVPGFRQDEFIDVTSPKHPCYSGHQHIWRQDEAKWRCTRCGNPDHTGRPGPMLPTTPSPFTPGYPTPGPQYPMTPGRIDVTFTKDTVNTGCLWDQLSPQDRSQPMGLSRPCPRCSPRC